MPSKKLSRTTYRDPTLPGNPIRAGDVARAEAALDMDEFYRPLEQVHASGAHGWVDASGKPQGWGVADGLRVTATLNQVDIKALPGIAIDAQGRHIALAEGGNAEIGANADVPGTAPTLTGVAATGATMPTAALAAGSYYVTIQWWETFDSDAYNNYGIYRINYTPWIRLIQVGGFADDGSRIVLARVTLGAGGIITGMTHELRRNVSLPAQVLQLRKGNTTSGAPNFTVDNVASSEIRARATGGMELAVPVATDEIHLLRDGGNFAKLSVAAQQIVARRSDGKESVTIDTELGNITAGTNGVEGDVLVKDANNRLVITLDGNAAEVVVGAAGNEGDILVKDNAGQNSVRVDGNSGDVWFRGLLRDPNGIHAGIGHDRLRHLPELTNQGFTLLHKHLNSGNAARPIVRWLKADDTTTIETVNLGTSRRVFAFISITSMDPRHDFDRGDAFLAEIYQVDGNDHRSGNWWFGGDHLGSSGSDPNLRNPSFVGLAQSITFRLRSTQDASVWALAVVFREQA